MVGEQRQYMVGIAGARVGGVEHEVLAGQLRQAQRRAKQAMPGRQHGDHRLLAQYLLGNGGVVDADAPEADVDTPAFQRLDLLHRGHFLQPQFQAGIAAQLADQLGQTVVQRRGRKADAEPLALALAYAPGALADAFQLRKQGAGLLVEIAPGVGQAQRPAALQQGHAEQFLELLDLPAQRWLGDVQALGGAGEVEGAGHFAEVAQVSQLHDTSRVCNKTASILDCLQAPAQSFAKREKTFRVSPTCVPAHPEIPDRNAVHE